MNFRGRRETPLDVSLQQKSNAFATLMLNRVDMEGGAENKLMV